MYNELKNEVIGLIKDKGMIFWTKNTSLEDIFTKYDLYKDQKTFVNMTTELCMDLTEMFETYHIEDEIIFSTEPITYYVHLGKVIEYLNNKLFTKEELRQAIDSIGVKFEGKHLSDIPLDRIYEMLYNEDDGLLRQSVYVVFGGDK